MRLVVTILTLMLVISGCRTNLVADLEPILSSTPTSVLETTEATTTALQTALLAPTAADSSLPDEYLLLYREGPRLKSLPPRPAFNRPEISHIYDGSGESFGMFLQITGPVASPNGRYVVLKALSQGPPPPEPPTWLVDLESGQVEKLEVMGHEAAGVGPVTWSPDGCCLTFITEDTLYVQQVETGGAPVPIFSQPGLVNWFARWSPIDEWIAVAIDANPADKASSEREYSYWLISPDGAEEINLGNFSIGGYGVVPYNMDWSPDGSLLLTPSHQILTPAGKLVIDGMSEGYVTASTTWIPPAWTGTFASRKLKEKAWQQPGNYRLSPGGQQLAFSTFDEVGQKSQVYIFDRQSNTQRLAGELATYSVSEIRWAADETFLVVGVTDIQSSDSAEGGPAIFMLDAQGTGSPQRLVEGDDLYLIDLIPNSASRAMPDAAASTRTTSELAVTPSPTLAATSVISPAINKILFLGNYKLHTLDVNTGQVTPIEHDYQAVLKDLGIHGTFYCPQWSPNRQQIALSIYGGMSSGLYLLNADGSQPRLLAHQRLPHGEGSPDIPVWSPDGQTIQMAGVWLDAGVKESVQDPWAGGWVFALNAQVTPQPESTSQKRIQMIHTEANEWGPVWSPDGQRVAFLSDRDGQDDIYLLTAALAGRRRLTNTPQQERGLTWSSDGNQLLYISVNRNANNSLGFDIYVINSDGSGQKLLAEGVTLRTGLSECHYPVWSPDGRHIAFMDNRTLFVVEAGGANPRKLLTWPSSYVEFDW